MAGDQLLFQLMQILLFFIFRKSRFQIYISDSFTLFISEHRFQNIPEKYIRNLAIIKLQLLISLLSAMLYKLEGDSKKIVCKKVIPKENISDFSILCLTS